MSVKQVKILDSDVTVPDLPPAAMLQAIEDGFTQLKALRSEAQAKLFLETVGEIFDRFSALKSFSIAHDVEWTAERDTPRQAFMLYIDDVVFEDGYNGPDWMGADDKIQERLQDLARDIYFDNEQSLSIVPSDYMITDAVILPYSGRARAISSKALLQRVSDEASGKRDTEVRTTPSRPKSKKV